jgi:hypothetical protein
MKTAEVKSLPDAIAERQQREMYIAKRSEVLDQARKLLQGKPVVIRKGDHVLCFHDIMMIAASKPEFERLMEQFSSPDHKNGCIVTLREFMQKAANWQVCEYLYPGESKELGFNF